MVLVERFIDGSATVEELRKLQAQVRGSADLLNCVTPL
jgi:hypothetical protein